MALRDWTRKVEFEAGPPAKIAKLLFYDEPELQNSRIAKIATGAPQNLKPSAPSQNSRIAKIAGHEPQERVPESATATLAPPATLEHFPERTVATVATVAVATSESEKLHGWYADMLAMAFEDFTNAGVPTPEVPESVSRAAAADNMPTFWRELRAWKKGILH